MAKTKIAFVHAAGAISLHGARQRFENVEFIFEVRGDHSPQTWDCKRAARSNAEEDDAELA